MNLKGLDQYIQDPWHSNNPQRERDICEGYYIKEIDYKTATRMSVENHYLHRKCPISFAFGLFDELEGNRIVGVVCYGTPSSAPLRGGICGKEEKDNVIELTRLWIEDEVPKNAESFLVVNTLKKVDKEIIVSFADPTQNHIGLIYQATNFIYTGFSAKRKDWKIEGQNKHGQTIGDKNTSKELREIYGDKFYSEDRPQKHRYIFFNCNGTRRKELLAKLKYPITPYPKIQSIRSDMENKT